jgi:hypothetical protein
MSVYPITNDIPHEVRSALTPLPDRKRQTFEYYAAHFLVGSELTSGDIAGNMRSLAAALRREYDIGVEHGVKAKANDFTAT